MSAHPNLVIATGNAHKTAEIREMLADYATVTDLSDPAFADLPEIIEDGKTFEDNSVIKSRTISKLTDAYVLADDSGLEVDSLNGAPGVMSARYSGEGATDATNRAKLLATLDQKNFTDPADRRARFRCVLSLARDGVVVAIWHGTLEGTILDQELGDGGFGYDSLFKPERFDKSLAQLSPAEKNAISHRGRTVQSLVADIVAGQLSFEGDTRRMLDFAAESPHNENT